MLGSEKGCLAPEWGKKRGKGVAHILIPHIQNPGRAFRYRLKTSVKAPMQPGLYFVSSFLRHSFEVLADTVGMQCNRQCTKVDTSRESVWARYAYSSS